MRVLFEALEISYNKGFWNPGVVESNSLVEYLYKGVMEDYIQCMECLSTRSRRDMFFDLQLVIKNISSVEDALRFFGEPEVLSEGNQYFCDTCARKVDALKGLRILEMPHLLCLQLKRFDFDWSTMQRFKLNNRVSFPLLLDVSPYIHSPDQKYPYETKYELFSVLVSSGGALVCSSFFFFKIFNMKKYIKGGHYFCYGKSFETGKWYNFNDTR